MEIRRTMSVTSRVAKFRVLSIKSLAFPKSQLEDSLNEGIRRKCINLQPG